MARLSMKVRAVLCCAVFCCAGETPSQQPRPPAHAALRVCRAVGCLNTNLCVLVGCLSAGKMIDNPTVLQARNVLALAERLDTFADTFAFDFDG